MLMQLHQLIWQKLSKLFGDFFTLPLHVARSYCLLPSQVKRQAYTICAVQSCTANNSTAVRTFTFAKSKALTTTSRPTSGRNIIQHESTIHSEKGTF